MNAVELYTLQLSWDFKNKIEDAALDFNVPHFCARANGPVIAQKSENKLFWTCCMWPVIKF